MTFSEDFEIAGNGDIRAKSQVKEHTVLELYQFLCSSLDDDDQYGESTADDSGQLCLFDWITRRNKFIACPKTKTISAKPNS